MTFTYRPSKAFTDHIAAHATHEGKSIVAWIEEAIEEALVRDDVGWRCCPLEEPVPPKEQG